MSFSSTPCKEVDRFIFTMEVFLLQPLLWRHKLPWVGLHKLRFAWWRHLDFLLYMRSLYFDDVIISIVVDVLDWSICDIGSVTVELLLRLELIGRTCYDVIIASMNWTCNTTLQRMFNFIVIIIIHVINNTILQQIILIIKIH